MMYLYLYTIIWIYYPDLYYLYYVQSRILKHAMPNLHICAGLTCTLLIHGVTFQMYKVSSLYLVVFEFITQDICLRFKKSESVFITIILMKSMRFYAECQN